MSELEDLKKRVAELEKAAKPPEPFEPFVMPRRDPTEGMSMDRATMLEMMKAVPESLMADLRADARKPNPVTQASSSPLSTKPSSQPQPDQRGTGWVPERGFPDRTKEFELMDRIVNKMVGGPNDPVK